MALLCWNTTRRPDNFTNLFQHSKSKICVSETPQICSKCFKTCCVLAALFTRSRGFARRERLFTLDPWLPCTISSSEEEQETHTTCERHINHSHTQHYHSIPSHLLFRFIDIPQQISIQSHSSSSTLSSRTKPRQHSITSRRHRATFACLDTEPYSLTIPTHLQHGHLHRPLTRLQARRSRQRQCHQTVPIHLHHLVDHTRSTKLILAASNPNSWPS